MIDAELMYEEAPVYPDDPQVVYEADIDENGAWVDCEMGYQECTGGNYSAFMVHDTGWMCPTCDRIAWDEWDIDRARYNRAYA